MFIQRQESEEGEEGQVMHEVVAKVQVLQDVARCAGQGQDKNLGQKACAGAASATALLASNRLSLSISVAMKPSTNNASPVWALPCLTGTA
jgi:hypothetical protein